MASCRVILLCLLSACCSPSTQDSRSYLVSAPKTLRLDARERVLVQLFGYTEESLVQVFLKSSMAPDHVLYDQTQLRLNSQNQYQDAASLRISERALAKEETKVVLHVLSPEINQYTHIPVSRWNGFLLLQTDKPLYTPGQPVKVRAFSLNEELSPALRNVFLTFRDPDRAKVDVVEMTDVNGVPSMQNPFKIPLKPKHGIWSIEGSYSTSFSTTARVEFEVKEYVLPSIDIKMDPESNYISYQNFNAFNIKISARYPHGAPVTDAMVSVRYGYVDGTKPPVILNSFNSQDLSAQGQCEVVIAMRDTLSSREGPRDLEGLAGHFLYVVVLVQETTGGIFQEAELATVKFLKSPYTLDLVATPPFIKPGLPYNIRVSVKDHLGKLVSGVPVVLLEPQSQSQNLQTSRLGCSGESQTRDSGLALLVCNPPADSVRVTMRVVTALQSLPEASQAEIRLEAAAYNSPTQHYLYIDLPEYGSSGLQVGRYFTANVYVTKPRDLSLASLSYLLISRGQIVGFGSEPLRVSGGYHGIRLLVTPTMVPSLRLLVYYVLHGELVADSIWVDIQDDCVNGLKTSAGGRNYKPKDKLRLDVKSTQEGLVALSAVDTAIYSLRVPHRDPINRVMRLIEQSDLGCGGGGGKDNADVFRLAGLTFLTNANAAVSESAETCTYAVRAKRHKSGPSVFIQKANSYRSLAKCCRAGMRYPPSLHTCRQMAAQMRRVSNRCRDVYEECCLFALSQTDELVHARVDLLPEVDQTPSQVRSYFPESWLWEVQLLRSGVTSFHRTLPDSLTTWEIRAVGVYNNGVCVAAPLQVPVSQRVSVSVPLPYSMTRGQQIQLQGSIYNMEEQDMEYCVTLSVGPEVCLSQGSGSRGDPEQRTSPCQMSRLEAGTVGRVQFTLLPLEAGSYPLTFALKTNHGVRDVLVKQLRVVPEGVRKEVSEGGRLDPQAIYGTTELIVSMRNRLPSNIVPKSSVERTLTINGDVLGEVVSVVEDVEGLRKLASLPPGSAEAELVRVLPLYHLYHYLEVKQRWSIMGPVVQESKDKLRQKIKEGLTSIASFKSAADYSYTMWINKESSTWLTAAVAKALAQVDKYVTVDHQSLSNTLSWLITHTQQADGSFRELSPHVRPVRAMGAGADALQQSVYVTSHVLIGLLTALEIKVPTLQLKRFDDSAKKAAHYISQHAPEVKSMHVSAVAAYALTLQDRNSVIAVELFDSLERKAQEKGNPVVTRFWREEGERGWAGGVNRATGRSVETTALVLLTSLLLGRLDYTKPILNWITQDQHYGGGLGTTQDVVLVLEALTEYSRLVRLSTLNLQVSASYTRKGDLGKFTLTGNHPISTPIQVTEEDEVKVSTGFGTGVSNVKLKTVYYELVTSSQNCNFEFSIEVLGPPRHQSSNYLWRSKRIQACARFIRPVGWEVTESSLTVMEIQLPTGVDIFTDDLKKLEPIISHYELKGDIVIIQMDSVPSDNFLCVNFRIQENFLVDAISYSVFRVYEPQDHGSMCSKLYCDRETKLLPVCVGEECVCVTAECISHRGEGHITAEQLKEDTCQKHIKYAFKVKVKSSVSEGDFLLYTVVLENIFKKDLENINLRSEVELIKKATCSSVTLLTGSSYLLIGSESITITLDRRFKYRYVLDSKATVDFWPSTCGDPACSQRLSQLENYEEQFLFMGC